LSVDSRTGGASRWCGFAVCYIRSRPAISRRVRNVMPTLKNGRGGRNRATARNESYGGRPLQIAISYHPGRGVALPGPSTRLHWSLGISPPAEKHSSSRWEFARQPGIATRRSHFFEDCARGLESIHGGGSATAFASSNSIAPVRRAAIRGESERSALLRSIGRVSTGRRTEFPHDDADPILAAV